MQKMSSNRASNRTTNIEKYKKKISRLKQLIKEYVHENAALCDEINEIQDKTIIYNEERKFLLKKLCIFDPNVEAEVDDLSQQLYNSSTGNNAVDRKSKKKSSESNTTNAEAVKKTSTVKRKSNAKPRKKIVQPIPLDPAGRPVFPIELGSVTIHSLGEVVCDRREFHTDEAIYPVGYVSTKIYGSIKDPTVKCIYTCKISDVNGLPRFEIAADDNSIPIIGASADVCHSLLIQKVNSSLLRNIVPTRPRGNDFFGLKHPTVLNLLQSSPGARKCVNYKWNKFEVSKNGDNTIEESEPTLNFEILLRSIELSRYNMDEFYNASKSNFA